MLKIHFPLYEHRTIQINLTGIKTFGVLACVCFLNRSFASSAVQYVHIIRGEELYRLARDYTRYLVTGKRTARLKRAMLNWREFSESITKKNGAQEDYYGRSDPSGSTWWQQPQQLARRLEELFRGYLRPHTQEA